MFVACPSMKQEASTRVHTSESLVWRFLELLIVMAAETPRRRPSHSRTIFYIIYYLLLIFYYLLFIIYYIFYYLLFIIYYLLFSSLTSDCKRRGPLLIFSNSSFSTIQASSCSPIVYSTLLLSTPHSILLYCFSTGEVYKG